MDAGRGGNAMTKNQIKQELRRSACEDKHPVGGLILCAYPAFVEMNKWLRYKRQFYRLNVTQQRVFMLFVAEAL